MNFKLDLKGQRFGRLKVLKRAGIAEAKSGYKMPLWKCKCDCGNIKIIRQQKLRSGGTQSCGCLRQEISAKRMSKLNLITDYKQYILDRIKIDKKTKCWEWTGNYFKDGRPRTGIKKAKSKRASRFAYEVFKRKIKKGKLICHKCDNPKCVNPDHLFQGTYADNSFDMVNKGRSLKGEKHHKAKLTEKEVLKIRKNKKNKTIEQLAEKFNISTCTIRDIQKKRSWTHI